MADLKTNYKDDVLDTSVNEKRKFNMIQNSDGTVSFEDVTEYSQVGDSFGAADINATNAAVNKANSNLALALTYNPNTDYFGATYNGEWHDVVFAGFQSYTYGTGAKGSIIAGVDHGSASYSFKTKGFKKAKFYVTVSDAYYSASSLVLKYSGNVVKSLFTNTARGTYDAIFEADLTSYIGDVSMDLVYASNADDGQLYVNKIVLSS